MQAKGTTLVRHILSEQQRVPGATGEYTALLTQIGLAANLIARELNQAGLLNQLGTAGTTNVQGEEVKKLDVWSNEIFVDALKESGLTCTLVSEEMEEPLHFSERCDEGKYIVCFDPIDGSSNIDTNGILGTIFSVRRRRTYGADHVPADVLLKGTEQVAAGYVIYGPSTLLVYTSGSRVDGFTLEPNTREFFLSHPDIRIPKRGRTYSANEGHYHRWEPEVQRFVDYLRAVDSASGRPYSLRYAGSLVADLHRTLLEGGVYLYPPDVDDPKLPAGKLRLLYEAAPLGYLTEVAGGRASTGRERILEIEPMAYHQRVPLIIGSVEEVTLAEAFFRGVVP